MNKTARGLTFLCFPLCGLMFIFLMACQKKVDPAFTETSFPDEIEEIILNKCATSGCHNDKSFVNAANLNLSSWQTLFEGSVNGAVVIPFAPEHSSFLQFINTYEDLGIIAEPTMPVNGTPLTRDEVMLMKQWVIQGCPNKKGEVAFESNPETRAKAYISNQGCDLVSVVDAQTGLVMRTVKVGADDSQIELPHCLRTAPDGKYWYVCFANGTVVQKFETNGDKLVAQVNIGAGAWNIIKIAPDSKTAFVSDLSANGKFAIIDLDKMILKSVLSGSGLFTFPHGMETSADGDTLYATAQYGNLIYRIIPAVPQVDQIVLAKGQAPSTNPQLLDPHEILSWTEKKLHFITCQASNEVKVLRAGVDTVMYTIPVGTYPLEMSLSKKRNLLFVVCQEEGNPIFPFFKGSVHVIDLNTMTVVRKVYEKFYQPHGVAVDDDLDILYVSSRNADPTGPAPHHISSCAGRNGFYHIIDLNTWQLKRPPAEISVDPYSLDIR
jgi:YVTN family beta-propeller protein